MVSGFNLKTKPMSQRSIFVLNFGVRKPRPIKNFIHDLVYMNVAAAGPFQENKCLFTFKLPFHTF